MTEQQLEFLKKLRSVSQELSQDQIKYWQLFSHYEAWQFWVQVLMIVIPLIVLFVFIDKDRTLLLGFFGLNFHVWFSYTNRIGVGLGLWGYPYHIIPSLPSFSLDAALVPVCFILLYQWVLNHKKNSYLYAVMLSVVLAFVFKPIMVKLDFFIMFNGMNYVHLFLFYMAFFIVSKLITDFFIWIQKIKNRREAKSV